MGGLSISRLSDAALVEQALAGRDDAAEVLVLRYQQKAVAVVHALGLSGDDADDAVQESFARAFLRLPDLRDAAAFGPWLLNTARNVSRSRIRQRRRSAVRLEPDLDAMEAPVETQRFGELEERLRQEVAALPETVREAIAEPRSPRPSHEPVLGARPSFHPQRQAWESRS